MKTGLRDKVAIFSFFWGKGYGVAAVIRAQIEIMSQQGISIDVFAIEVDPEFVVPGVRVVQVPGTLSGLKAFVGKGKYSCAIAHTQPFHRFVADLGPGILKIVYDHGEPPPEWFPDQKAEREALRREKLERVCPKADVVVAISRFIAEEIPWPSAKILYNGADHLYNKYPVSTSSKAPALRPTFLCVARFGPQERVYKGLDQLVRFAQDFKDRFDVILAGKGTATDRMTMEAAGLMVVLNPSDRELSDLYHRVDAVISFSKWEGFNLPLIEGAFFGRPGYALDVGAHKEVTPFCFSSYEALRSHLEHHDKETLRIEGCRMRTESERFRWRRNVDDLVRIIDTPSGRARASRLPSDVLVQCAVWCYWRLRSFAKRWKRLLLRA